MEIRRAEIIKDSSQTPIGKPCGGEGGSRTSWHHPFQQASFDIMYGEGISKAGSILDVATDLKIIDKKGAWFSFDGTLIGQGREQSKVAIKEDPELEKKLVTAINEKLKPEVEAEPEAKSRGQAGSCQELTDAAHQECPAVLALALRDLRSRLGRAWCRDAILHVVRDGW